MESQLLWSTLQLRGALSLLANGRPPHKLSKILAPNKVVKLHPLCGGFLREDSSLRTCPIQGGAGASQLGSSATMVSQSSNSPTS